MCKAKLYKNGKPNSRIDKCMKGFIMRLGLWIQGKYSIIACCCGHNKYPMSIIVKDKYENVFDIVSGELIPRKRKFYKKDEQGYYYVPEACTDISNKEQKESEK